MGWEPAVTWLEGSRVKLITVLLLKPFAYALFSKTVALCVLMVGVVFNRMGGFVFCWKGVENVCGLRVGIGQGRVMLAS